MHTAKLPFHYLLISVPSLLRLPVDYKQQLFPHRHCARRGLSRSRKLSVPEPLGVSSTCGRWPYLQPRLEQRLGDCFHTACFFPAALPAAIPPAPPRRRPLFFFPPPRSPTLRHQLQIEVL